MPVIIILENHFNWKRFKTYLTMLLNKINLYKNILYLGCKMIYIPLY